METWDAIRRRRNVREFADRPIEPEKLERILDAGRRAPSSMNQQRWAFVVCSDRARLQELARIGEYARHAADAAAVVALVAPDVEDPEERESIAFDLGQCVQNIMLAAWELGIGSCHGSVYEVEQARQLLGYPEGYRCDLLVSLGYPAQRSVFDAPLKRGKRKPMRDLLHRERW